MKKVTLKVNGNLYLKSDIDVNGGHEATAFVDGMCKESGESSVGILAIGTNIVIHGDLYADEIRFANGIKVNILCAGEIYAGLNSPA